MFEGCCADRGVSQIIWQSVERHRTSDSECPTTVSVETKQSLMGLWLGLGREKFNVTGSYDSSLLSFFSTVLFRRWSVDEIMTFPCRLML